MLIEEIRKSVKKCLLLVGENEKDLTSISQDIFDQYLGTVQEFVLNEQFKLVVGKSPDNQIHMFIDKRSAASSATITDEFWKVSDSVNESIRRTQEVLAVS